MRRSLRSGPPRGADAAWWVLLVLAAIFAVTGHRLRSLLLDGVGPDATEMGLWVLLGGVGVAAVVWPPGVTKRLVWRALAWLLLALAVVQWAGPDPTDPAHLLLFGSFGFFSGLRFGVWRGLAVAGALAVVDELVQLPLAHRVADWGDLGLDLGAALVGSGLAWERLAVARSA